MKTLVWVEHEEGQLKDATLPTVTAQVLKIYRTKSGKDISRVIDIQKAWGEMSGGKPVLPQAGLAVTNAFAEANRDAVDRLQAALEESAASVNAYPEQAAAEATAALEMPVPVLTASVATSNLVAHRASAARAEIEAMLNTLSDADPALIGGKLPDDGFYL